MACANTAGWLNPYGLACKDYETEYCAGGGFRPGQDWAGGKDYNYPERNCCACGKCTDQPGWDNGYGKTCGEYEVEKHCASGTVVPGQEWTTGAAFNYPERACCACGHVVAPARSRPASPSPSSSAGGSSAAGGGGECVDDPGWRNPYGVTCAEYVKKLYCAGGAVLPGKEWTVGPEFSHPERACCAC
eukprot:scaffold18690_cov121-Isochrysis_galbana.AAC.1